MLIYILALQLIKNILIYMTANIYFYIQNYSFFRNFISIYIYFFFAIYYENKPKI